VRGKSAPPTIAGDVRGKSAPPTIEGEMRGGRPDSPVGRHSRGRSAPPTGILTRRIFYQAILSQIVPDIIPVQQNMDND